MPPEHIGDVVAFEQCKQGIVVFDSVMYFRFGKDVLMYEVAEADDEPDSVSFCLFDKTFHFFKRQTRLSVGARESLFGAVMRIGEDEYFYIKHFRLY